MATKKSPTKKPTRAASARAKQTTTTVKNKKTAKKREFMSFTPTLETLYWLVLGVIIIVFTIWIMDLQANIQGIYDQININNADSSINIPVHAKTAK